VTFVFGYDKFLTVTVTVFICTVVVLDRQCGKSIVAGTGFRNKAMDTCNTARMLFWMCWETGSNCQPWGNQYVIFWHFALHSIPRTVLS